VRDSLAAQHTVAAKVGAQALTALLAPGHWNKDGSVREPVSAFVLLGLASPAVSGTSTSAAANANLLVSVARDITQERDCREWGSGDVEDGGAHSRRRARPASR